MIFTVEASLQDGTLFSLEVMACDKHEAQIMFVQALADHIKNRPNNVVRHRTMPKATHDATGQVEESTPAVSCAL